MTGSRFGNTIDTKMVEYIRVYIYIYIGESYIRYVLSIMFETMIIQVVKSYSSKEVKLPTIWTYEASRTIDR